MSNLAKEIIYVGKATSLRKRVGSYFSRALNTKTEKLVSEIDKIDFSTLLLVMYGASIALIINSFD